MYRYVSGLRRESPLSAAGKWAPEHTRVKGNATQTLRSSSQFLSMSHKDGTSMWAVVCDFQSCFWANRIQKVNSIPGIQSSSKRKIYCNPKDYWIQLQKCFLWLGRVPKSVTCSVFLVMRFPMVLLKKDASRGLRGDGCSKKAYRLSNRDSSLPSFSLISPTSHVSNSHAIFEYL